MAAFGKVSVWAKIGFLMTVVGFAIFVAGFATNFWMVSETVLVNVDLSIGLWKMTNCTSGGSCYDANVPSSYVNDTFIATQVFACLVMIGCFVAVVLYAAYIATDKARSRCMIIIIITITSLTGLFALICMICWLVQIPYLFYADYSIGLAIFGSVMVVVAGFFLLPDYRANDLQTKVIRPSPAPPRSIIRTPSPSPSIPYSPTPVKTYRRIEKPPRQRSPVYTRKKIIPPDSPRTPAALRIEVLSPPPSYRSLPSYNSKSPRRYGTPKYSQRYDYKAR